MAGFGHHDHHPKEAENAELAAGNARRGSWLFAVYLVFYGAFVLLSAFGRSVMQTVPFGGVNLAVWYGFGLIGGALLLALVYAWLCRSAAKKESA